MADNLENEIANFTQQGPPHEALFLTLTYLPLLELLSISETCTSIRDAVLSDVLPWLHITVTWPLNNRLTDKILMKYASKANGSLKSLVMIKCTKISDDGLQQVLEQNPLIGKLHVPGCTGLTPDGIVTNVKKLSKHSPNLTSLKISGIYNINQQHLQTLQSILMANLERNKFPNPNHFVSSKHEENDTSIDVDICPICDQVRLVFACSKEDCTRKKNRGVSECRACPYCIARCIDCGKCMDNDEEVEIEVACEDTICPECWLKLPKCILCNKPYCKDHAELRDIHGASDGFVCDGCVAKFSWPMSYD